MAMALPRNRQRPAPEPCTAHAHHRPGQAIIRHRANDRRPSHTPRLAPPASNLYPRPYTVLTSHYYGKKWFDCAQCHEEQSNHPLMQTFDMTFICKKCKKAFRKDAREFEDADEYCPHCDNHFVLEAKTPKASLQVEGEDDVEGRPCPERATAEHLRRQRGFLQAGLNIALSTLITTTANTSYNQRHNHYATKHHHAPSGGLGKQKCIVTCYIHAGHAQ
ncbi:hypothetical protein BM1_07878 [Bipolaris maydis]|nr:hypothetical protein BM1_07878 [Bipolaris maydis]